MYSIDLNYTSLCSYINIPLNLERLCQSFDLLLDFLAIQCIAYIISLMDVDFIYFKTI